MPLNLKGLVLEHKYPKAVDPIAPMVSTNVLHARCSPFFHPKHTNKFYMNSILKKLKVKSSSIHIRYGYIHLILDQNMHMFWRSGSLIQKQNPRILLLYYHSLIITSGIQVLFKINYFDFFYGYKTGVNSLDIYDRNIYIYI